MASLLQRLLRSFINTLFYIWTVIQALLSLRSPKLYPFREPATVVPYIVDVDLERCSGRRERATPMPSTPPPSAYPNLPQTAISRTIDADSRWQKNLRSSSVFSPSTPGVADRKNSNAALSASLSTSSPTRDEITEDSVRMSDEPFQDPFLDTRFVHPLSFSPGKFELDNFKLPCCTSTPRRTRKGEKGHKRAALATITNIAHLALPVKTTPPLAQTEGCPRRPSLALGGAVNSNEVGSAVNPNEVGRAVNHNEVGGTVNHNEVGSAINPNEFGSAVNINEVSRTVNHNEVGRAVNVNEVGRTVDHNEVGSALNPNEVGRAVNTNEVGRTELQFKTVSPLRIVKRNTIKAPSVRTSTASEASIAVISAVRGAFVQTREEHPEDEGAAARELISRESVLTCDGVSVGPFRCDISEVPEMNESGEGYSQEMSSRSPPPPYMHCNPAFAASLNENGVKPSGLLHPDCDGPAQISTESSYVKGPMPLSSVDSGLDDILASFENLISSMPKFKASLAKAQDPALLVGQEKIASSLKPSANVQRYVSDDPCGGHGTHWSDVLRLDSY
ncbi:hypothetical protein D9615_005743 [Tricholomella constricta]|uniref:Uncharacterized protein n=1 Tax=Tricholomella constricta TaxID=117010 RepID=A0A8H5HA54_9AGAR|nr:hypothetical protein D9615_005743 [Tricholomella constricta]